MQKKLLTLAVAGALGAPGIALAQTGVEVYGFVNMSFGNVRYTGGGPATAPVSAVAKWDVASHASNYGLRARESLGGGWTGWFQIETNAPMERSNNAAITPASRNSAVGLQGGFGNVFLGQWTTPWADLDALWSVGTVGGWGPVTSIIGRRETTGTAPNYTCSNVTGQGVLASCDAIEAVGGAGHAFWRRTSQSVFYQSPVMGGAQLKLAYQTNEGKANSSATLTGEPNPSLWSASVQWAGMGGRLRGGIAHDRHKEFTSLGNTDTGWAAKGGWNFGVVDVGLAYEMMTYKCGGTSSVNTCGGGVGGDVKARQWGVALAVPVGTNFIRASYAVARDMTGPATATVGSGIIGNTTLGAGPTGGKTYNVGYEHRFSKRTSLGAGYAKIDNKSNASFSWTGLPGNQTGGSTLAAIGPALGTDVSTFFVNMIHRF